MRLHVDLDSHARDPKTGKPFCDGLPGTPPSLKLRRSGEELCVHCLAAVLATYGAPPRVYVSAPKDLPPPADAPSEDEPPTAEEFDTSEDALADPTE